MLDDIPDDELRDKLQHYSENPDEDLWQKINDGISRPRIPLSEQLKGYHEQPDASVWSAIERGLVAQRTVRWVETTGAIVSVIALLMLLYPAILSDTNNSGFHSQVSSQLNNSDNDKKRDHSVKLNVTENPPSEKQSTARKTEAMNDSSMDQILETQTHGTDFTHNDISNSESQVTHLWVDSIKNVSDESDDLIAQTTFHQTPVNESGGVEQVSDTVANANGTAAVQPLTVITQDSLIREDKKEELIAKATSDGQEKKKIKNRRPRGLYLLFMPTFGYNKISPVKDDDIFIESIEKISAFSSRRLGIRAEAGYEKFVTERLALNVGLVYFQRKQTIQFNFRDPESFEVKTVDEKAMIYDVELLTQKGTFEYELKNAGLSAGINYFIKGKRFTQKIGIATELHKSLSRVDPEVDSGQKYYLFGNAYYRLAYPIGKRFDAMFQPTFNYALQLDERLNAPFYVKPYGLGLNFGVYFHL